MCTASTCRFWVAMTVPAADIKTAARESCPLIPGATAKCMSMSSRASSTSAPTGPSRPAAPATRHNRLQSPSGIIVTKFSAYELVLYLLECAAARSPTGPSRPTSPSEHKSHTTRPHALVVSRANSMVEPVRIGRHAAESSIQQCVSSSNRKFLRAQTPAWNANAHYR